MNRNGGRRLLTITTMLGMLAGCRAPLPKMRSVLSPPGSTTVAAPGTGAISDNYYPSTTSGGPSAEAGLPPTPPYQPRVVPAMPLDPPPAADKLPPASDLDVSQGAPTRLRISRSAAQGVSWSASQDPAPAAPGQQAAPPSQEPRPFLPPVQMLEISELPNAPPRRATAPIPRVTTPPVLTTPGAAPAVRPVGGADSWQSRNQ